MKVRVVGDSDRAKAALERLEASERFGKSVPNKKLRREWFLSDFPRRSLTIADDPGQRKMIKARSVG